MASTPTASSTSSTNRSPVNTGAIIAGVVGGLIGAIIIGVLIYLVVRRRRRGRRTARETFYDSNHAFFGPDSSRGFSPDGSAPLLHQHDLLLEHTPYSHTDIPLPVRPAHPPSPLNYSQIDLQSSSPVLDHPIPRTVDLSEEIDKSLSSSPLMQESLSPVDSIRPSLPPLFIPPSTSCSAHAAHASVTSTGSVDDAASQSSVSVYSQASALSKPHRGWNDLEDTPPVPPIPLEHLDEGATLRRGDTEKVSRLLKSRARRARGGRAHTRSESVLADDESASTRPSHMETVEEASTSPSLEIRNPFQSATSSRSTSVTTIANHPAYSLDPQHVHRLTVIENEDAETESVYPDEVSSSTRPLRVAKP